MQREEPLYGEKIKNQKQRGEQQPNYKKFFSGFPNQTRIFLTIKYNTHH